MTDGSSFTNNFEDVRKAEHEAIRTRRSLNQKAESPKDRGSEDDGGDSKGAPKDLFGVALSGGGIRSASFCLGALQALDQYDLIKRIDYLSTVSGGGYTGASMIAAMTAWEHSSSTKAVPAFPFSAGSGADVRDSEPVSHIRDHSRYLTPGGVADVGVSLAIVLRGLAVNLLLLLTLLIPLAALIVVANPTDQHLGHSVLLDIARHLVPQKSLSDDMWSWIEYFLGDPLIVTKAAAIVLAYWLVGWALYRSYAESSNEPNSRSRFEFSGPGATFGSRLVIIVLVAFVVELQPVVISWLAAFFRQPGTGDSWLAGFGTLLGAAAAATALFREKLVGWIDRALNSPTIGKRAQAWLAWAGFYALGLALPLLIYGAFVFMTLWGIQFTDARGEKAYIFAPALLTSPLTTWWLLLPSIGFMILVIAVSSVFFKEGEKEDTAAAQKNAKQQNKKEGGGQIDIVGDFKEIVVALALIGFVALCAASTRGKQDFGVDPQWTVLVNYVLLSFLVILVGVGFTENANGLYRLYRDRLRVAFRLAKFGGDSLPLHELGKQCPYLLVNGTLNVRSPQNDTQMKAPDEPAPGGKLSSPDPAKRGRNAEFFLFSKEYVGSPSTGFVKAETLWKAQKELDIAACVAISGAAVSSSMGRISVGLLGPTLSLLNVRLGFWLRNPREFQQRAHGTGVKRSWVERLRLYLFAEAAGLLRSDSAHIYITDGGHIDNIGLYQLLKRRCKFIVVIDAEADPGMNFGAFCDAQRFARIDEGVRVSLDWQPVRAAAMERSSSVNQQVPADSERHKRHFAIGTIRYEPVKEAAANGGTKAQGRKHGRAAKKDTDAQDADDQGILLYVKASMTGDEPDYVLDYERRYPRFPHESTGDQFFSEEQMEAYRALGFHAMRIALKDEDAPVPDQVAQTQAPDPAGPGPDKHAPVLKAPGQPVPARPGAIDKDPATLLKMLKTGLNALDSIETPRARKEEGER